MDYFCKMQHLTLNTYFILALLTPQTAYCSVPYCPLVTVYSTAGQTGQPALLLGLCCTRRRSGTVWVHEDRLDDRLKQLRCEL